MKKNSIHKIGSLLTVIILLFPFGAQTFHALEGHHHTVCQAKNEKHFHVEDNDCSIFHKLIRHQVYNFESDYSLIIPVNHTYQSTWVVQDYCQVFKALASTRGPPHFIV